MTAPVKLLSGAELLVFAKDEDVLTPISDLIAELPTDRQAQIQQVADRAEAMFTGAPGYDANSVRVEVDNIRYILVLEGRAKQ